MERFLEIFLGILGGVVGWFVGMFHPAFPLLLVAITFIMYDSWTAYELDKRVKAKYPDRKQRPAKYVSYKAWGMIPTMIESVVLILLMYAAQRWVFVDFYVPLSYVAAGAICGVQFLSIAENKASCRDKKDSMYKLWKVLAKILIDKTERHFDTDLSDLEEDIDKSDEF